MLDLQFLPHLMITNPHVRQVYNEYFQAFETLRDTPEITTMAQNREFTSILENLLAQHGAYLLLGVSLRASFVAVVRAVVVSSTFPPTNPCIECMGGPIGVACAQDR